MRRSSWRFPELGRAGVELEWVSPLEKDGFAEYRDEAFLAALGHSDLAVVLAAFWPRGGPQWDALATVRLGDQTSLQGGHSAKPSSGVLLVEAKSYPAEMESSGCRAGGRSRALIERSLTEAMRWFGADPADWCGPLYQFANRLAHVYFFRERAGVPAWFVNVCFVNDPRTPTTEEEWRRACTSPTGPGIQRCGDPLRCERIPPGLGKRALRESRSQA